MGKFKDKYKGSKIKNIKKKRKEEAAITGSGGSAEYHSIESGSNHFRIFPPHNPEESYDQMQVKWWLPRIKDNGDRGQYPFPHMKNLGMISDLVETYKVNAMEYLEENDDEADAKIKKIKDWRNGLSAATSWTVYAKEVEDGKMIGDIKLLEYGKSVHDDLDNVMATEEENESIEVDPFTDPDDGLPIVIKYNPKAKQAKDKYDTSIPRKAKPIEITEAELEIFDKMRPLTELGGNFSEELFDSLLESLELFDEDNEIGYFETDDFQDEIKTHRKLVKEFNKGGSSKKKSKVSEEQEEKPKKKSKEKDSPKEEKKSKKKSKKDKGGNSLDAIKEKLDKKKKK